MASPAFSPRDRFQQRTDLVRLHQKAVDGPQWDAAADAAMLQFVNGVEITEDPIKAAAAYHAIMGAREFLKVFKGIAEIRETPPPRSLSANLQTNV